ncbi:Decarbamoylnovobiocin carbamoyltransferase [Clostridium sp. C105KSO15]|nr:Decarbamoylnovobiocin carbamoyltransferase [Clostridium sp. C105KSO15]
MKIIGINSSYDASMNQINSGGCAYINDGKIIAAIAEERVSRCKDMGGFLHSLDTIYKEYELTVEDIDYFYISFYANPIIPEKNIIRLHLEQLNLLDCPDKLVIMPSHHFSHACLAHFLSPFEESIIMVADNEGSLLTPKDAEKKANELNYCERNSYYWARGNCITMIGRDFQGPNDVGFGKAYNIFTSYIGLGNYLQAGKTMGLSSYGYLPDEWKDLELWSMDKNGNLNSYLSETEDAIIDLEYYFRKHGIILHRGLNYHSTEYKQLAFFVQQQLNKWSVRKMKYLSEHFNVSNLCVSGGVALNSIMNYELGKKLNMDVFVPPYCSDPGQALGNAVYGYITQSGKGNNPCIPKFTFNDYIYLGLEYDDKRIEKELINEFQNDSRIKIIKPNNPLRETAKMIAEGRIIGCFQGRSEYGARALGNRSILAMPNSTVIRDRINRLKGRESFRPIAPAVLSEARNCYFEEDNSILDQLMLRVVKVKEEYREDLCGITHIDGTARLQVVDDKVNPIFHELIKMVYELTDIPIVTNTSFNKAGDPIVETPHDAVTTFLDMGLDGLLCGNYYITKK